MNRRSFPGGDPLLITSRTAPMLGRRAAIRHDYAPAHAPMGDSSVGRRLVKRREQQAVRRATASYLSPKGVHL
ncbi:hypothetical protein [Actinoallomurus sp. NPDC052274]|uniref:hypothetical protein n=1 Tax=Actinoallomurus sp. NPDC052274 TaxID=3155420 RepID=UPI00342FBEC6